MAHHPIIQKEVDELIAKHAKEPLSGLLLKYICCSEAYWRFTNYTQPEVI